MTMAHKTLEQIREQILKATSHKYMRRKYRVFDDPEAYFKSAEYKKNRQEVFRYFGQNAGLNARSCVQQNCS